MSEKISDKEALEVLNRKTEVTSRFGTKYVDHTVVYPVKVKRSGGAEEIEIRTFVRAGEYTTPRRWEEAKRVEKEYKALNDDYIKKLRAAGIPEKRIFPKEVANPLDFRPMFD
jgi:hypothetical protein